MAGNSSTATQALTVAELGITITTIAGDNVVNASEAAAGFAISGSETGANGSAGHGDDQRQPGPCG